MQSLIRRSTAPIRNPATTGRLQTRVVSPGLLSNQLLNASRDIVIRPTTLPKSAMSTYAARDLQKTNHLAPQHRPQLNPRFSKILAQIQNRRCLTLWDFYFPRDMTIWDTLVLLTPLFFAFFLGVVFHWCTSEPEGSAGEGGGEDDEEDTDE